MAVREIKPYLKVIQRNLLPALKSELGLVMNNEPSNLRNTTATYSGNINNTRVLLEFSSNHKDLADANKYDLFVKTYYGSSGNEAGIIDLTNIPEAVEQIYSALYELGYRSEQDIADEKARQDEEKRKAEEDKKAKEEKRKQDRELEDIKNQQMQVDEEPIEEINPAEESAESISDFKVEFDKYLNVLKDEAMINGQIMSSISFSASQNQFKLINVDMYFISATMCLVQTSGINPKVDKAVSWDKAKNYIIKVAEKLQGTISTSAVDANGKEITISEEDTSNDIDVDVNI